MLKSIKSLATLAIMGAPLWAILAGVLGEAMGAGTLVVQVNDPVAEVWVGDRRLDSASRTFGPVRLAAGEHRVRVLVAGVPVYDRAVAVEPGERAMVRTDAAGAYHASADDGPIPGLDVARRALATRGGLPTAVGSDRGGRHVLSAGSDGILLVHDARTGAPRHAIQAHEGRVLGLTMLADGRRALTTGDDQALRVWDVDRGTLVREVRLGNDYLPVCTAATADGRRAAVGHLGGLVQVFDLETGREIRRRSVGPCTVGSLAFSPDGLALMIGLVGVPGAAHPVPVWDLATGSDRCVLRGHDAPVWALAFLPDGRALTGGSDHTLRLWDATTGAPLKTLKNHPGVVFSVAVSPDGRHVLTGTGHRWADGWSEASAYGAQVWDVETGRPVGRLATDSPVRCVAFSDDGRIVVAGSEDRRVQSWTLPPLPGNTTDADTLARRRNPAPTRNPAG